MSRTEREQRRIARERADLEDQLREQVGLLAAACSIYDVGNRDAAKFMAVTLRLLLHHTQRSHGLLEQLGLGRGKFAQWDFHGPAPKFAGDLAHLPSNLRLEIDAEVGPNKRRHSLELALSSYCRLAVVFNDAAGSEYMAPLSSLGRQGTRRFRYWWNDPVIRDTDGRTFSRKDLVLDVANTDGGAHVDPQLEERYMSFSRRNSLGWRFLMGGGDWNGIPKPHLPCLRQISHEALVTLQQVAPRAFDKPYLFGSPLDGRHGYSIGGVSFHLERLQR